MQLAPLSPLLPLLAAAAGGEEKARRYRYRRDGPDQFAIFVVVCFVLRRFLFAPYLKMRAGRAERIEGPSTKAQAGQSAPLSTATIRPGWKTRAKSRRAAAHQNEARAREGGKLLAEARASPRPGYERPNAPSPSQVAAAESELGKQVEPLAMALLREAFGTRGLNMDAYPLMQSSLRLARVAGSRD